MLYLGSKVTLSYILFPIIFNLFFIIFLCASVNIYRSASKPENTLSIIGAFALYLFGILDFYLYGRGNGGWSELFYSAESGFHIVMLMIGYPVFFLFWLPVVIYNIMQAFGAPHEIWERWTGSMVSGLSVIPFVVFCLLYVIWAIIMFPILYYAFNPMGFGMFGIALHAHFHFPSSTDDDLSMRIENTYDVSIFTNCWIKSIIGIIISSISVGLTGSRWYNICFLVVSSIVFLVDSIPSILGLAHHCAGDGIHL